MYNSSVIKEEHIYMSTKKALYTKYVNEENFKKISDINIRARLFFYSFAIPIFLIISVGLVSIFGYNFAALTSIISCILAALCLLIVINCVIRFVLRDREYRVFNKNNQLHLFLSVYFFTAVIFYIVPIFTVKYLTDNSISTSGLIISILCFSLIYLPINIGYMIFSYFAYIKCFWKYILFQIKEDEKGEAEEDNQIVININNKKTSNNFYKRFIYEENLKNIEDLNVQQKFYKYNKHIPILLFLSALLLSFSKFDFDSWWKCVIFAAACLFLLQTLYFAIRAIILDIKYRVFKRRWFPFVFILGYYILTSAFYVFVYFEITISTNTATEYDPTFLFLWLIFLPLLIQYHSICNNAYNKCFKEYCERGDVLSNKDLGLDDDDDEDFINVKDIFESDDD